jgi:hypothetical protein
MKRLSLLLALSLLSSLTGCATSSLEQIVESRHQARIDAANANRPLTQGAGDGLGASFADSASRQTFSLTPIKTSQ